MLAISCQLTVCQMSVTYIHSVGTLSTVCLLCAICCLHVSSLYCLSVCYLLSVCLLFACLLSLHSVDCIFAIFVCLLSAVYLNVLCLLLSVCSLFISSPFYLSVSCMLFVCYLLTVYPTVTSEQKYFTVLSKSEFNVRIFVSYIRILLYCLVNNYKCYTHPSRIKTCCRRL